MAEKRPEMYTFWQITKRTLAWSSDQDFLGSTIVPCYSIVTAAASGNIFWFLELLRKLGVIHNWADSI